MLVVRLVCPHSVASRFTTLPLGARGRLQSLIVSLLGDLLFVFLHEIQFLFIMFKVLTFLLYI